MKLIRPYTMDSMPRHFWQYPPSPCLSRSTRDKAPGQHAVYDLFWLSKKRWSTGLGQLLGVELRVHISLWVLLAVALIFVLAKTDYSTPGFALYRIGMICALILAPFGSILAHEMAHVIVAEAAGKPVKGVLLHPLGGLAVVDFGEHPGRRDMLVYLAGPMTNLAIAGALAVFANSATLRIVAQMNRDIGIFNLIPIFPLDGSRILQEVLILRCNSPTVVGRITLLCSQICCVGAGIYGLINQNVFLLGIIILLWLVSQSLLTDNCPVFQPGFTGFDKLSATRRRPSRFSHILFMALGLTFLQVQETGSESDLRMAAHLNEFHSAHYFQLPAAATVVKAPSTNKAKPSLQSNPQQHRAKTTKHKKSHAIQAEISKRHKQEPAYRKPTVAASSLGEEEVNMYIHEPIDTSKVELPSDQLKLAEIFAKNGHDRCAAQRTAEDWTYASQQNETTKRQRCIVPYAELPEKEKKYDRKTQINKLKAILPIDYRINRC